jgi:heptaprenylglyceryl phosphate synthase
MLIQNSLSLLSSKLECIPTVYVFDDRDSVEASHWLSRAIPVPRHKPYLSLSIALAAQLSGSRFYIMAGGSGCKLIPPIEHIKLIKDKTSLFLIPTSGIKSAEDANQIFTAGGDAIHVGKALESTSSDSLLSSLVSTSQKFPGQDFF